MFRKLSPHFVPITIERDVEHGDFNVRQGIRSSGSLTWEEMLGHIVELTHPAVAAPRIAMLTDSEWMRREQRRIDRAAAARAGTI